MQVSIITVCYNSEATIRDTIESVLSQTFEPIQYIIIDGASTDETLSIIREYRDRISMVVSEPDRGMWDAMNKGLARATGEYIGFLNADDQFASDSAVAEIMACAASDRTIDAVFGFVDIVDRFDTRRVLRRYRVRSLSRLWLQLGLMPAHPTFYCRREFFEAYGGFLLDMSIAPDFELMARFVSHGRVRAKLLPKVLVNMRNEGFSNSSNWRRFVRNRGLVAACRRNEIRTWEPLMMLKWPYRLFEYLRLK